VLFLAILLVGAVGLPSSAAAQPAASTSPCNWKTASTNNSAVQDKTDLAGRLGSNRDQFEALYGQPIPGTDPRLGPEYKIDGCGEVQPTFDPNGYLVDLWVFSPAPPDRKIEDPDPADWSIPAAFQVANNFAPLDTAQCGDVATQPNPTGYLIVECSSPALLDQVPQSAWDFSDATPTYGSYAVVLQTNKESGIWGIDLKLGFDDDDFPPRGCLRRGNRAYSRATP